MFTKTIKKVLFAFVVVLLLLASFFAGRMHNKSMNVQAQEMPEDETRGTTGFNCDISQVSIFGNRAHIKCTNSQNGIAYFAVANTSENQIFINRVIAIGLTNLSMNRYVYVFYDTLESNNPTGCNMGDCRKLLSIGAQE